MIRGEIKRVTHAAAVDLELPKSAIGAKTKVTIHANAKPNTSAESSAPAPAE
jgi:hypothetical protein